MAFLKASVPLNPAVVTVRFPARFFILRGNPCRSTGKKIRFCDRLRSGKPPVGIHHLQQVWLLRARRSLPAIVGVLPKLPAEKASASDLPLLGVRNREWAGKQNLPVGGQFGRSSTLCLSRRSARTRASNSSTTGLRIKSSALISPWATLGWS